MSYFYCARLRVRSCVPRMLSNLATKQRSLPACVPSSLPQTLNKRATGTFKKEESKHSLKAPIRSEATIKMISLQPTQPDTIERKNRGEKLRINKTQTETEFENIALVTSMIIDKTQASISQRLDDSADTGEYVDDLPEEREQSSSE
uniref:EKC/KEOPS complex subunit GON7 n=1 Tax=Elaeophora elaphi TaxID=1147741 RepID=A0A0R3S2X6_9BILA